MWFDNIVLPCLYLVATTASASRLPERHAPRQRPLQQSLQDEAYIVNDTGSSILANPQALEDLFWSLTTDDAIRALQEWPAMEHKSQVGPVVFDKYKADLSAAWNTPHSIDTDHAASLEISMSTIGGYPVYHTPIAIGNPAQPFRAWLNMNLNGLYVRSTACSKEDCGRGYTYDPKQSATRKALGHRFEVHPKDWTVGGIVSTDTLHLVSVDINNATVGEIDKYEGDDLFYYVMEFIADG